MSEELQNETLSLNTASTDITETASSEAIENSQAEPELATENEVNNEVIAKPPEEVEADKEAKRQAAFNKQYGEKKQMERERDEARRHYEELKQTQQPEQPQDIGKFPSEYDFDTDEEYEAAKTSFIGRVQQAEQYKQNKQNHANYAQQQQNIAQQEQQVKFSADSKVYADNARKLGITVDNLTVAANAIIGYGATPQLITEIMNSQDPLVTLHLAANPQAVESIISAGDWNGRAIFDEVKIKAQALKPKQSNTPKPTADITGSSPKPPKHPELEGVIYSW